MVLALILATLDTLPAPEEPQGEPEAHTLLTPLALRHFPAPWAAADRHCSGTSVAIHCSTAVTASSAGGDRGGAEMTSLASHVPGIRATGSSHVAVSTTP